MFKEIAVSLKANAMCEIYGDSRREIGCGGWI
jgi:hypothetical protein